MPKNSAPVVTAGQGLAVKSQRLSPDQVDMSDLGAMPSADASMTLDFSVPSAAREQNGAPAAFYNTTDGKAPNGNNGLGLRSDCQPAANCQAGQATTAYNTMGFIAAEDFVPASSGFISTACLQGIFWNGVSSPSNLDGWCTDNGSEDWTLTFYDNNAGIPNNVIGSLTFCTGTGCTGTALPSGTGWSSDSNVTNATKEFPTGNPDFASVPIERITVEFANFGEDGFAATQPLQAGECYFAEWAVLNSDTTSGTFGCAFFHQAGVPGNGRAMQDATFDGYDCCETLSEDLTLCIDLPLDNSAILDCDQCVLIAPGNASCSGAFAVTDGVSESVNTAGALAGNGDLPEVPGLEGFDMSDQEGVFYTIAGNGNQWQLDFSSDNMDAVIGVYCGACNEKFYGVAGDDDSGGGVNGTDAQLVLETENGVEYIVYLTSTFKCGTGTFTATDLTTASTVPAGQCDTCTLAGLGTATVDEATFEPCDDTGNTRLNDGCNATGVIGDFMPLVDGDVVSGTGWQFGATRDTDWFGFTVADPGGAIVTWQGEAQFNFNLLLIDIGGDLSNADCANLSVPYTNSAQRCQTATVSGLFAQGDYVCFMGGQEFDFGGCATTANGYGPDTSYNAALSIASCDITDPGDNLEGENCGVFGQNNNGCNKPTYLTTAITPGDGWYFGNSWANQGSRDTDFYSWTQGSAGEVSVTAQSEFPLVVLVIDLGVGGHVGGAGCPGTIVDAWASVACNQLNFTSSTLTAGNDYSVFVGMGNLDGSGIFAGFPCGSGFNDYVVRVDGATVAPAARWALSVPATPTASPRPKTTAPASAAFTTATA
jgi:hypothetical protein